MKITEVRPLHYGKEPCNRVVFIYDGPLIFACEESPKARADPTVRMGR
jgi:hypothetical protein